MGKKFKAKVVVGRDEEFNDQSQTMMTEQEEKMYYANKKMAVENTHLGHIKKKHTTTTVGDNSNYTQNSKINDDQQYDNIEHLELSNLNHTSAEQITEFINKLIAKNKVTSRNAFDIPLIHLQQMEDFRSSLNQNTWKRLSSTLQNDYKIYGYRVDAAHTITYKMVESIARHQAAGQEGKCIENNGIIKSGTQNGKHKSGNTNNQLLNSFMESSFNENVSKNKMNVDYTRYIEKNQKLINVTHIQAFFSCNPGLQKTKRKFDQQGFKALLLNNIALRNGCELKLDEHRTHNLQDNDQTKKQNIESIQIDTQSQGQFIFQQILQQIFADSTMKDKIQLQKGPLQQQSVFDKIYQLNTNECQSNKDEFRKFEKLYKIISGEQREEKRQAKNKDVQMEMEIEEGKLNQIVEGKVQKSQDINERKSIVQQNDEVNGQIEKVQGQAFTQSLALKQHIETETDQEKVIQSFQDAQLVQENPTVSEPFNNDVGRNQPQTTQQQEKSHTNLQIIPETVSLQNYHNPNHQIPQNQHESHILFDKNFQMRQLNVQQMEQSPSIQQSRELHTFIGKLKNIEEYIKIKQPKVKQEKKAKLLIDDMTSEEIGKKLFNRNYRKKKTDSMKLQHSIKEEAGNNQAKKKVDFSKVTKPSNDLKRSLIFKKSVTEERNFHLIKQKLKKKLQERKNIMQNEQNENIDKKRKAKKAFKVFDLPIYQFQQGDLNFLEPYQQIDPQTSQLEFSSFYKDHFPSFVDSSLKILEEIKKRKQDREKEKERQEIAKIKEIQQKQQQRKMIEERFEIEQKNQDLEVNSINAQRPEDQQNDDLQPDISFICDEMGQLRGKHQVAIRDAKERVSKIILQMFYNLKSRKNNGKKHKKISFKEIYEAYYRRQGFISPALCFLTILHLANQHNLILQGKQNGTDFKIFVEECNQIDSQFRKNEFVMELEPIIDDRKGIENSLVKSFSSTTKEEKILDMIIEE